MVATLDKSDDLQGANLGGGAAKSAQHSRLRSNILGLLILPVAILTLEGVFNLAGVGQGEIVKPDPQMGCRHIANKAVTWRLEGYSRDRFNSLGMRDSEPVIAKAPGTMRIAYIGDSFTEGLQVERADTFAEKVRDTLNKKAALSANNRQYQSLNFGCSSYSTGQELLQYEREIRPFKPDLVIVLYTPGDTLENSVMPKKRSETEARPYFYLDQKGELREDDGLLVDNAVKLRSTPLKEFLRANSTIFGAYTQMHLSMTMADKVFFRTTRLIDQTVARVSRFLGSDKIKAPANNPSILSAANPDQVAISAALVKRFAAEVKADGAKFVLMMYPDVGGGNLVYAQSRDRLARLAAQEGFGYLDLSAQFKKDVNPNNLFVQVHFSKLGHDLTTRQLTSYLQSAGYLK